MTSSIYPVNKNRHATFSVRNTANYSHVSTQHLVPVVLHEFIALAAEYPLAFVKNADTGRFQAVAVLGLAPGENLFFSESGWRAHLVPGSVANYPFILMPDMFNPEQLVVAINEASELIGEGAPLFDAQGEESDYLQKRKQSLLNYYEQDAITYSIIEYFVQKNLFKLQSINLQINGQAFVIGGIYMFDEQLLQQLSDSEFLELRQRGLLPIVYAQLASLQQLQRLVRLKADQLPA